MKRIICCIFAAILLVSLAGCSANGNIVGTWEQEMEVSILGEGVELATSAPALCRFTFREDGTGLQEHILQDESYPDAAREFTWQLEGDSLTLEYVENHTEVFSVVLAKTSLKLENRRGSYDLVRAE